MFIWVRATIDWEDPDRCREQLDPAFRAKAESWNGTLSIPYCAFRAELRRIARLNLDRVRGADVVSEWDAIPEGAIVLPVDDDDWFAPAAAEVIGVHLFEGIVAWRWPTRFLEVPISKGHALYLLRRKVVPFMPEHYFCSTNNYAVVKRPGAQRLAASHEQAHEALVGAPGVKRLDRRLSLVNRSLASQTTIGMRSDTVTRQHLLEKYRLYRSLYRTAPRSMPGWALPYVELMDELMERLEIMPRS